MKKKLINSQLTNVLTYEMIKRQMLQIAENVFQFENMPELIDISYLNSILIRHCGIAFFEEDVLHEVIALPFRNIGVVDRQGLPIDIEVYGENGYRRILHKGEYVIMYDNNGRYPLFLDIRQYAERIASYKRTIDVNIAQQKTPRIWLANNDQLETVKALLNQVDGNVENVVGYDTLDLDEVSCVLNPAPFVADKIEQVLEKEWNEFLRLIGVSNLTAQKRERLITDEVQATQGGTIASRFSRFEPRKRAIEQINKKFNLDIKVKYYDGIPTSEKELLSESEVFNDDVSLPMDTR